MNFSFILDVWSAILNNLYLIQTDFIVTMTKVKNNNKDSSSKNGRDKLDKINSSGVNLVGNYINGRRTSPRKKLDLSKQQRITDFLVSSRSPSRKSLGQKSSEHVERTSSKNSDSPSGRKFSVGDAKKDITGSAERVSGRNLGAGVSDSVLESSSVQKTTSKQTKEKAKPDARVLIEDDLCKKNTNSSNSTPNESDRKARKRSSPSSSSSKQTNSEENENTSDISQDDHLAAESNQSGKTVAESKSSTKTSDQIPATASSSDVSRRRSKLKLELNKPDDDLIDSDDVRSDTDSDADVKPNDNDTRKASYGLITPRPALKSFSEIGPSLHQKKPYKSHGSMSGSQISSSQETIPYQTNFSQSLTISSKSNSKSKSNKSDLKVLSLSCISETPCDEHVELDGQTSYSSDKASERSEDTMSVDTNYRGSDDEDHNYGNCSRTLRRALSKNIEFYTNKRTSEPKGDLIENILKNWHGCYDKLEEHHGYIQWLFPINENGMNCFAQQLQPHEAEFIKKDKECSRRFILAYELMLDFYGLELEDRKTGKVALAENFRERFSNLNVSFHNNLRITRIIKCLGMLGFEHYQAPLVEFLVNWSFKMNSTLMSCRRSCVQYWLPAVLNNEERQRIESHPKVKDYKQMMDKAASRRSFVNYYH